MITLTKCNHIFHYNCLLKWNKNSCPNCRSSDEDFRLKMKLVKNTKNILKEFPVLDNQEDFINSRDFMDIRCKVIKG